jgi:hypothetical protein
MYVEQATQTEKRISRPTPQPFQMKLQICQGEDGDQQATGTFRTFLPIRISRHIAAVRMMRNPTIGMTRVPWCSDRGTPRVWGMTPLVLSFAENEAIF